MPGLEKVGSIKQQGVWWSFLDAGHPEIESAQMNRHVEDIALTACSIDDSHTFSGLSYARKWFTWALWNLGEGFRERIPALLQSHDGSCCAQRLGRGDHQRQGPDGAKTCHHPTERSHGHCHPTRRSYGHLVCVWGGWGGVAFGTETASCKSLRPRNLLTEKLLELGPEGETIL